MIYKGSGAKFINFDEVIARDAAYVPKTLLLRRAGALRWSVPRPASEDGFRGDQAQPHPETPLVVLVP
jgi:hypothetical protein